LAIDDVWVAANTARKEYDDLFVQRSPGQDWIGSVMLTIVGVLLNLLTLHRCLMDGKMNSHIDSMNVQRPELSVENRQATVRESLTSAVDRLNSQNDKTFAQYGVTLRLSEGVSSHHSPTSSNTQITHYHYIGIGVIDSSSSSNGANDVKQSAGSRFV